MRILSSYSTYSCSLGIFNRLNKHTKKKNCFTFNNNNINHYKTTLATNSSTNQAQAKAKASVVGLSNGGIAFFGGLCIGTFGLGVWQTKRYFEKIELCELRKKEISMEPLKLMSSFVTSDDDTNIKNDTKNSFRRVCVEGKFLSNNNNNGGVVLVGPRGPPLDSMSDKGALSGRSQGGMGVSPQGYYVIVPFLLSMNDKNNKNNQVVFVNRGWIPMAMEKTPQMWFLNKKDDNDEIVNIVGVTTQFEKPSSWVPTAAVPSKRANNNNKNDEQQNQFLSFPKVLAMRKEFFTEFLLSQFTEQPPLNISDTMITETFSLSEKKELDKKDDKVLLDIQFPVKALDKNVGEFKVLPPTHAAYATTWYGLSMAGIFMTRKLMTRGR